MHSSRKQAAAGESRIDPGRLPMWEFTRRASVAVALTLGGVMLLLLLWQAAGALLLAFAGFLVAVLLHGLGAWVSTRTGMGYRWSLAAVVALLGCVAALTAVLLGGRLAMQIDQFLARLPETSQYIQQYLRQFQWGEWILSNTVGVGERMARHDVFSRITGVASGAFSVLASLFVIAFIGLYGAWDPARYRAGLLHLVPLQKRDRTRQVLDAVVLHVRRWLLGQIFCMVVVGIMTATGLWLLGVEFALVLGILAMLLELVPNLGPVMAAIPALLLASGQGGAQMAYVTLLYFGVQTIESYVLLPLVQQKMVWLPPAITIFAVVLLGMLTGIGGVLFAAPLTVVLMVLIKTLYVEDALGDRSIEVPGEERR
jgi:predicted PurR-regulated permease PerM